MKKKLFVALSHKLTAEQIADFDGEIVLLSTLSPELAEECSNIDPTVSISHIQHLAAQVVVLAVLAECTHFCCQGEPGLQMWVNLMASGKVDYDNQRYDGNTLCLISTSGEYLDNCIYLEGLDPLRATMTCITSTTPRQSIDEHQSDGSVVKRAVFKHVMWRELF